MFFAASRRLLSITARTARKRRPPTQLALSLGSKLSAADAAQLSAPSQLIRQLLFSSAPVVPLVQELVPKLSASERVLVVRVVGADASRRGDLAHLHLLRSAQGLADVSPEELDAHHEAVLRRSALIGRASAHADLLAALFLHAADAAYHERALAWLLSSPLSFQLQSARAFHQLVQLLVGDAAPPLSGVRKAVLDGVLAANFPDRALLFYQDYDWRPLLVMLASKGEFDWLLKLVDLWFAHVPSPSLVPERHFLPILVVLAHAHRGDIAERIVERLRQQHVPITATTCGVMVQVWGRTRNLEKAREWYCRGLALPNRRVVFYVQAIDMESFLGTWTSAMAVAEAMVQDVPMKDMQPNAFSTVLEAMIRHRDFSELDKWYGLAEANGHIDEKLTLRYSSCVRLRQRQRQQAAAAENAKTSSAEQH